MSVSSLFWGFVRVGAFTFGGGQSILPLMQRECVEGGFVSEPQFLEGLAVGNALPGPISTKMAIYVGWQHHGLVGAAVALLGLLLPSTVLMAAAGAFLVKYRNHPLVSAALSGLKPAIVGMLFFAAVELAPAGVRNLRAAIVALAAFAALWLEIHPAVVVVVAMGLGLLAFRA